MIRRFNHPPNPQQHVSDQVRVQMSEETEKEQQQYKTKKMNNNNNNKKTKRASTLKHKTGRFSLGE